MEELPVTGLGFCLGTWVSVRSLASPHDKRPAGLSRAELTGVTPAAGGRGPRNKLAAGGQVVRPVTAQSGPGRKEIITVI